MSQPATALAQPRIETTPLSGSALSRRVQEGTLPASWHLGRPHDADAWRTHTRAVRRVDDAWYQALRPAFGPHTHSLAAQRLTRAASNGVVVTTGQQPGLFGGPAYTLTKALSALALADELQQTLGIPVAPVFWAATDDSDWQEASLTHVVGRDGLQTLHMSGSATDGVAMAHVPLGDTREQRAQLRAACGSVADPLVLDLIDAAYDAHAATVGSAYVTWLRSMLEPLGVSVLDASHDALRTASHPILCRALQHAAGIDLALHERSASISDSGFLPQVELVDGLSLVFHTTDGVRSRVPLADAISVADAAQPGSLGANVLLRPVVERALMPTVAYVAGPGELGYFAQVSAVAEAAHMAIPVAVPRWSARWVEPHTERVLERLGVQADELRDPHAVENRLARAAMDRDVSDSLDRLRVTLNSQVIALTQAVAADDQLVPAAVLDGVMRDLEHRVSRTERRLLAAVKKREVDTARDVAIACAALYPNRSSPERVLSLVPTLARYGMGVLSAFRSHATVHARALVRGTASPPA